VDPKKAKARHGKIFVGGLVPELSDDDIKNFFAQYGTVGYLLLESVTFTSLLP
jgi:squid-like protein